MHTGLLTKVFITPIIENKKEKNTVVFSVFLFFITNMKD